jgi:hypothetical protein
VAATVVGNDFYLNRAQKVAAELNEHGGKSTRGFRVCGVSSAGSPSDSRIWTAGSRGHPSGLSLYGAAKAGIGGAMRHIAIEEAKSASLSTPLPWA